LQVIEVLDDARQVADAISVGILKGTRVDLIDDAVLPPKFSCAMLTSWELLPSIINFGYYTY